MKRIAFCAVASALMAGLRPGVLGPQRVHAGHPEPTVAELVADEKVTLEGLIMADPLPQGYTVARQDLKNGTQVLGQRLLVTKVGSVSKVAINIESRAIDGRPAKVAAAKGYVNGTAQALAGTGAKLVEKKIPDLEKADLDQRFIVDLVYQTATGAKLQVQLQVFFEKTGYNVQVIGENPADFATLAQWANSVEGIKPRAASVASRVTKPTQPPAAPDAAKTQSSTDIAEESEDSVALVKGRGGSGTGFLAKPGILVTNAHVIEEDFVSALEIRFPSAEGKDAGPFPAELLYEDTKRDLAVLAVKTDLPPLRVAPAYKLKKGEDITVIGNPGVGRDVVLENAITRGVMSTKTAIEGQPFYQMGIAINPGNSGGPVFDSKGQVIGVATLKSSKQEGLAFCIPVEDLNAALAKVESQTTAERDATRARHRVVSAVQGLGSGGALFSIAIDLHRALAAGANKPEIQQTSQKLDTAISELEKEEFPSYPAEVFALKSDKSLAPSVRDKVLQLSENFGKLKSTYGGSSKTKVTDDVLKRMKSRHRQLITDLSTALKIPMPPAQMMTAFDDRKAAAPPPPTTIIVIVPQQPTRVVPGRPSIRSRSSSSIRSRSRIGR